MQQWHELETLKGFSLQARDGEIGKITDVYFDDERWVVRYFVVRTGGWLMGREVLIAPSAVQSLHADDDHIVVDLTREQVENSPPVDSAQPVSRHYETQLHTHYGWAPYWMGGAFGAMGPVGLDAVPVDNRTDAPLREPVEPHLRSSNEVRGYGIHAQDGEIGEVDDFVITDDEWAIRYLVVDTRKWLPGKKVLVAPTWVQAIRWSDKEIAVDMDRETLRTAPEYDGPQEIDKAYEIGLYKHYGIAVQHADARSESA